MTDGSSGGQSSNKVENKSELDELITAVTSPIPYNIFVDYDKKSHKKKHAREGDSETALEHTELKGPVFREFTIHIFQSISFL